MLMLEGLNQDCVDFKPNYDNTTTEPTTLPSKFPYLLCGNNSGIAVGMSSDLVSHNFTEVAQAIKYYMHNKDTCSVADLMRFIKGPDFPTGGRVINGDDLLNIYTKGKGSVRVCAHYDVIKRGAKTLLVFKDIPYGVEIDSGIKAPLKKLVIEEGYDIFEDIDVKKAGPRNFDVTITLGKNADVAKCLDILFAKTRLSETIKINQTVIVNGEPRLLNLKELIQHWVNYRSAIICRIARNEYAKTNHKLTITLGLQKCMSNIDRVIEIVRFNDQPKQTLMSEFNLNDEQADAVLDIRLARLSKLEVEKLQKEEKDLEKTLAKLQATINDEAVRYEMIAADLDEIKKILGKDERLTEINYTLSSETDENGNEVEIKREWLIYPRGLAADKIGVNGAAAAEDGLIDAIVAGSPRDIWCFNADGDMSPIIEPSTTPIVRTFVRGKQKVVSVTAKGNIKVTSASDYKWRKAERVMKLKEDDKLVFVGTANDDDYVMLFNGERVLKLAVKNLPLASKLTVGVKSGFSKIVSADIVSAGDVMLIVDADNKGKLTPVADFSEDSRGNKGQSINEKVVLFKLYSQGRENFYVIPKLGKPFAVPVSKLSTKSKTACGAAITTRNITNII